MSAIHQVAPFRRAQCDRITRKPTGRYRAEKQTGGKRPLAGDRTCADSLPIQPENGMLFFLSAAALLLAMRPDGAQEGEVLPSICWVSDVVASEKGVTIYFPRNGGPLFVSLANRIFRPADAPIDPRRPQDGAIDVEVGQQLYPSASPEDGCKLLVANQMGRIGVLATANFRPTGLPPESRTVFIPAHD